MSQQDFEQALRRTLGDRRLSRGEQRALRAVLADLNPARNQLGAYRRTAFELARAAIDESLKPIEILDWLEEVLKLLVPQTRSVPRIDACFSPGEECRRRICGLLGGAKSSVDLCVFTITDNQITEAIVASHQRGAKVRIITDDDKAEDRGSDIEILERCGIEIRVDRSRHHMHHKFAIFDEQSLLTGSYNWTVSAMRHNEENLVVTDDVDLVGQFSSVFDSLWKRFA